MFNVYALCVFHDNHKGLILQEVLVVLDDVWVAEHREYDDLVESSLPLLLRHLLHRDLLDDHMLLVTETQAQVYCPGKQI